MDFTLKKYIELCNAIQSSAGNCVTVAQYLKQKGRSVDTPLVVLRHDVDRMPGHALKIAKVEREFGLFSSYYFRIPHSWDDNIIKAIADMGHEVGHHYECLDKTRGDMAEAGKLLKEELEFFRQHIPVETVAMHGNPLSKYNNLDMWGHFTFEQFGLLGEAYLSIDYEDVFYYSDTGRTWEEGKYNIKDRIPDTMKTSQDKPVRITTDDLIKAVKADNEKFYLLTHPNRWSNSFGDWLFSFTSDCIINQAKVLITMLRKLKKYNETRFVDRNC